MNVELICLIRDTIVGVSALAVAVVGVVGLSTWKSELKGKAKFDVVRRIMALVFQLRSDFEWARFPLSSSIESADRVRKENETPGESEARDQWYAKNRRLQPLRQNLQKLQEVGWEAEAILHDNVSTKVSESITALRLSYGDLASAVESLCETELDIFAGKTPRVDQNDWLKGLRAIVYSSRGDSFSEKIDNIVEQLASVLKLYVK